jgi:hypothetical protein
MDTENKNGGTSNNERRTSNIEPSAFVGERVAGELDENVLEQVARVGLVAGQIQEKDIKRLGVPVVEPSEVESAHA